MPRSRVNMARFCRHYLHLIGEPNSGITALLHRCLYENSFTNELNYTNRMKFLFCHAQYVQMPPSIYFYTWTKFCPKKFRWSVKCWLLSPAVCLHVTVSHLRIINLLHALMTALLESGTFSVAMRREFFEVCFQKVLIGIFQKGKTL